VCEYIRVVPDHTVHVWDLNDGKERVVAANKTTLVWEMTFSADSATLLVTTSGGTKCWTVDPSRGKVTEYPRPARQEQRTLSPAGQTLAGRNADGTASLWDAASGEELAVLAVEAPPTVNLMPGGRVRPPSSGGRSVVVLAFSPDGKMIGLADNQGGVAWCEVALARRFG
jgi:WD40 repeat protein